MSMAIAYAMKKRAHKMAKGGEASHPKKDIDHRSKEEQQKFNSPHSKGVHHQSYNYGSVDTSHAGAAVRGGALDSNRPHHERNREAVKQEHVRVLGENREINPKLKGLAEGGEVDGYQSECTEHCESPCMVHPQESGYEPEMMAKGGHVKGVNRQHENRRDGTSEAGHFAKYQTSSGNSDGSKDWTNGEAKKIHHKTLSEMRSMPKPNLPMAEGGEADEDMVGRVMKKRAHMYSKGGQVANDTPPEADFEENQFDDLVKDDELQSHYSADNSGDMDGDEFDADHDDMVARVMMKRRKQQNPRPA